MSASLKIHGIQGHIAYPDAAENPIHRCAKALHDLSETRWDNGNNYFPPTTFQISSIHAGTDAADNVIPAEANIELNLRFGTASTPESLKRHVETLLHKHALSYGIQWRLSGLPFLTEKGLLIEATARAAKTILERQPALSTAGGTSDGRFIAPTGAQVIELGPVNKTIHKINERIASGDPDRLSRVYCRILSELLRQTR
ncbi:MAG: Succinyl-diaminopimelate desuccinylase [Gammaproteobacteria bacterium]|nr:Succinyl-diaminopimelate desuccinylase [Gammaproteobacteria bacterium]